MFPRFRVLNYLFSVNARNKTIAHCLNFNIVASADTLEEAEHRLDVLVRLHIESFIKSHGASGLSGPARKEFFTRYTHSLLHGGALPPGTLRINVPEIVPMEKPAAEQFEEGRKAGLLEAAGIICQLCAENIPLSSTHCHKGGMYCYAWAIREREAKVSGVE
jgi:hypothetical protein